MDAATFSFSVPESSLPSQPRRVFLGGGVDARNEVLVAGEHHHHDEAAHQRDVDERQHHEHEVGLLHGDDVSQRVEHLLEELDAQREQAERQAEVQRREQPAGGVEGAFDEAFDHGQRDGRGMWAAILSSPIPLGGPASHGRRCRRRLDGPGSPAGYQLSPRAFAPGHIAGNRPLYDRAHPRIHRQSARHAGARVRRPHRRVGADPLVCASSADVELREGGSFRFWGRNTCGAPARWESKQKVVRVEAPKLVSFSWPLNGVGERSHARAVPGGRRRGHGAQGPSPLSRSPRDRARAGADRRHVAQRVGQPPRASRRRRRHLPARLFEAVPRIRHTISIDAPRYKVFDALITPAGAGKVDRHEGRGRAA